MHTYALIATDSDTHTHKCRITHKGTHRAGICTPPLSETHTYILIDAHSLIEAHRGTHICTFPLTYS